MFKSHEIDLFDEMFEDAMFSAMNGMNIPNIMRTDISEIDGQYLLEVELPGYRTEDIKAELKDGYLTIFAYQTQKLEKENEKRYYLKRERYVGGCKRSFFLGADVMQEDIHAAFKDGILRILVRKPMAEEIEDTRKLIDIQKE